MTVNMLAGRTRAGRAVIAAALAALLLPLLAVPAVGSSHPTNAAELASALCPTGGGATVVLGGDITDTNPLTVACTATLDLNGFTLTVPHVLLAAGAELTIRDTSPGSDGELKAESNLDNTAGIQTTGATLRIEGGKITATGGLDGAGIGGGSEDDGGTIIITGGVVTATGGSGNGAAGIGGGGAAAGPRGGHGGTITISGGNVTAVGGSGGGAGIGGGSGGAGGVITISGGTIDAEGNLGGAGIGGGSGGAGGKITISDGTITANGGASSDENGGAGIGGGGGGPGGEITISGGTITANGGVSTDVFTAGEGGAGIGGGNTADGGTITISGGLVTASGGVSAAGIGGGGADSAGPGGDGGTIAIDGISGNLVATSGFEPPTWFGIGGGSDGTEGMVTLAAGIVPVDEVISGLGRTTLTTLPGAPTAVEGAAGDGRVSVTWAAPAAHGGSAVTGYVVTAAPGGATCTATAAETTCDVTGLTNGTPYTFTVVATSAVGNSVSSAASAPITPAAGAGGGSGSGSGTGSAPAPAAPSFVAPGGVTPALTAGVGAWVQADGSSELLAVSSPGVNQLRYAADGVEVTFTGGAGSSVSNGLVADADGEVVCEVCVDLAADQVIEVWMFSTPRLVAAHLTEDLPCQRFAVPVVAPLDGGVPVTAGAHTLQIVLPTASGMQAINVGVTVGGPVPASVPAGQGPVPMPLALLLAALVSVAGAVLIGRRTLEVR